MNYTMAGGLMVQLAADVSKLKSDMDEAKKAVNQSSMEIDKAVGYIKTAFVALAGIGSIAAFTGMVKSAIDAQAALHDLSITTGVSVAALGQFKSVGAYTETSIESITGAMTKLAKNMATSTEESKGAAIALKALGIDFNDFKKMGPDEQMLAVAKAMNEFKDGADKSAAAQALFGKEGAKLLPFLKDLGDAADDITAKLTDQEKALKDAQAAMADAFGDNLTQLRKNSEGWKKDLSMGLLPALYEASEAVLKMTGGTGGLKDQISKLAKDGTLAEWARGAMTALSYLVDVAQALFSLLPMLGKVIAGVAAGSVELFTNLGDAIGKVLKGDFSGAVESMKAGFNGVKTIGTATAQDVSAIWNQKLIGETFRDTMDALKGTQVQAKQAGKDLNISEALEANERAKKAEAEATKRAAEEQRKLIAAYEAAVKAGEALIDATNRKGEELQKELDLGRKLTAAEKELIKLEEDLKNGKIVLTDAQEEELRARIESNRELEREIAWNEQARKANEQFASGLEKKTEGIQQEIEKLRESNAMIGLNKEQVAALEIAKLNEAAATAQQRAEWAEENMLGEDIVQQYKDQAAGLRELAKLKGEKVHLEAAVEARDAWTKTTEEIGKSFTDSLFRAFEEGKSFGEAFMSSLKNLFKTTVLKLLIQPVQQGMNNMLGNIFGGLSGGGGGSGGAGMFGGLGNMLTSAGNFFGGSGSTVGGFLTSMGGSMGAFGSAFSGGSALAANGLGMDAISAGWTMAGNGSMAGGLGQMLGAGGTMLGGFMAGRGVGQAISGGYSAFGSSGNAAVNIGSAIGGAIGGLVNRAFGRGPKESQESGIQGSLGSGGVVNGQTYSNWKQKGGWFRSDKYGTDYGSMDADMAKMMGEGAQAVLKQSQAWAAALKLPGEALANVTTSFKVKLGSDEKENSAAIAKVFDDYQNTLSNTFESTLKPFQKAGETLTQTLSRLASIQAFSESINQFGGVFSKIAGASIEAKEELVALAGGIEAFAAKTQAFVDAYYTDAEKAGLQAKQVGDALRAAGLSDSIVGALDSKAAFRKLVESQDINTADGRKMFNDLLSIAPAFAQLAQYLEQNKLTLGGAASSAPEIAALQNVLDDKETQQRYHDQLVDRLTSLDASVVDAGKMTNAALERLIATTENRFASLEAAMRFGWKTMSDYWMEREQP